MRISDWSSDVCSSDLGSGELSVGAVTADLLDARIVGTGQMTLAGTAQRALVTVSGAGSVAASDLVVNDLTARSDEIGRASCRERVCQYVSLLVVAVA